MRRLLMLGLFILMIPFALQAQNIQVSGTVLDANNEPLPGVNVVQTGTTNGTITDLDGKYTINVPSDATLTFSYIGFTNHVENVNGRTSIPAIILDSDDKELEQVVVVGYGTQRKSDLTGSVASVKGDDLMNRSTTDAAAAIQGKAAGVQILNSSGKPGQGASIRVRGYSSNSDNIGPLLIVDGLQVSSIQYLDPSLIESMEVLKDAASAAIYGAEAGNGVVLITTKSGKSGKGSITYDAKFINQSLGNVPELLNASQFKDWMTLQLGEESVTKALADATTNYGWNPNTNTNWLDEYFENTWAQQHTLTFQGGNDRGTYFASIGHVNQNGIVKGNKDIYERLTAQINADYKVKDWLQIGTNTSIEKWRSKGVSENGSKICSTGGWGGGSINHEFAHKMLEHDGDSYRRKATFLTSDEFFYDETLCPWSDDLDANGASKGNTRAFKEMDPDRGITKSEGSFSRSDVMEVKMMMHPNDADLSVGDNCNNTNVCLARLAEAYLIYAEACIATGNQAEAFKYIQKIQDRAGVPADKKATEATLQVLQDEKEYELWFEGCRWFDIVRWGIAKQCYDKVLDNIPYQFDEYFTSGKTKPHKLYYEVRHPFKDNNITLEFIEGKHEYWPIPQSVLDVNPQMHQVRGWK